MEQRYNTNQEYDKYQKELSIWTFFLFIADAFFFTSLKVILQEPYMGIGTVIFLMINMCIFLPILWKWIRIMKLILKGISRKYLSRSLYSFVIYWIVIFITILLNGNIKGEYLLLYSGFIVIEGFIFSITRAFYFLRIMRKYYPSVVKVDFYAPIAERERRDKEVSDELQRIENSTCIPEVLKALEDRNASVVGIFHVLIPFFSIESILVLGLIV